MRGDAGRDGADVARLNLLRTGRWSIQAVTSATDAPKVPLPVTDPVLVGASVRRCGADRLHRLGRVVYANDAASADDVQRAIQSGADRISTMTRRQLWPCPSRTQAQRMAANNAMNGLRGMVGDPAERCSLTMHRLAGRLSDGDGPVA